MKVNRVKSVCLGICCAWGVAAGAATLGETLSAKILPGGANLSSWEQVYRQVDALDAQADADWRALKTRAEYDAHRTALRTKMIEAIGGFPERTPLNARTTGVFRRDGYAVEKVRFESMPGLVVTANLFVPDDPAFKPPYPAVVMSCGHAQEEGKDASTYQRACVLAAKRGMVAFMFDPYEQGERRQFTNLNCCVAHDLIGLKAMLLGWSMPMLRLWDGIRAVDYVMTRAEVDREKVGYMGQSGGGTMTALMTAVDWRLKATAPSCFLTSLGYLCKAIGPQDAEQNVYGQLAFGLNHTGYVLLPDTKVCVTGRYSDMFPWGGTAQLLRTVDAVADRLGTRAHYAVNFAPGPHGWTESTMTASVDWMAAWLRDEKDLLPLDMAKYRALDVGHDPKSVDCGIPFGTSGVTPGYNALRAEGSRSIHHILKDRLAAFRTGRKARTADETAALVKKLAGIRLPAEAKATVKELGTDKANGVKATKLAFVYPDGFALPAVLLKGKAVDPAKPPVLMVASKGRGEFAAEAERALKRGERVVVADVTGAGEIGKGLHVFYWANDVPEEGTAVMLYLLGESMVGRRASDILLVADWMRRRFGGAVRLSARGSVSVAAAHAFAADRAAFAGVSVADAPASWTTFVETTEKPLDYHFVSCVNGALEHYDWTDLLKGGEVK